jgi:hypothetical protein
MERRLLLLLVPVLASAFVTTDIGLRLLESSAAFAQQQKKKRQGVFERLFRPRDQASEDAARSRAIPPRAMTPRRTSPNKRGGVPQASGMRTICVRACDGYYFPISYSASRKRFKIDEAVCKAMYGGAGAELFVHNNGSPANMAVSLKGKPMKASTNAFAYRHFFSGSCQGQLKRGLANLGEVFLARIAEGQSHGPPDGTAKTEAPTPVARVPRGEDPETLANLAGRFTVAPVISAVLATPSVPIRKLGPVYYYTSPIVITTLRDPPPRGMEFTLIGSAEARGDEDKVAD